jgi:endonuclease YncB( thermonuclease family)
VGHRRAGEQQPWGTRAKEFTGDLAFGKIVIVRVRDIDRYRRTVGEVILPDGRNLNQELVHAGFAWWYRQFAKRDALLPALEQERGRRSAACGATRRRYHRGSGGRQRAEAGARGSAEARHADCP